MNLSRILNNAYAPSSPSLSSSSTITIQTLLNPDNDPVQQKLKRRRLNEPPSSPISTSSSLASLLGDSKKQISHPSSYIIHHESPVSSTYSLPLSSVSSSVLPKTSLTQCQYLYGAVQETEHHVPIQSSVPESETHQLSVLSSDFLPDSVGRRLSQARVVGLRHRMNEKRRYENLELDIFRLEQENDLLKFQIREAKRRNACTIISTEVSIHVQESPKYLLSGGSSEILGVSAVNGATALLFLEFIALRRNINLFGFHLNSSLESPKYSSLEDAVQRNTGSTMNVNMTVHLEIHARWAYYEANSMLTEEKHQTEKRCTRCSKSRSAGSGHPRSSCDDGFKVASDKPYRPILPEWIFVRINILISVLYRTCTVQYSTI